MNLMNFEPFPLDALPDPCREFATEAADAIGCDPSFVAVPMLAALAGCVGNSTAIQLKRGWVEPSVIWSVVVGDSGTAKSPGLDAPLRPLHQAQIEMVREHEAAVQNHLRDVALHESDYAIWKQKGRGKGEPPPEKPPEPVCRRIIVSDTTVECLGVILKENDRGILLARDELAGFLLGMNQYKSKGADAQNYLTMHGARPLIIDRKGSSPAARKIISIPRAAVSICGTIQPSILQQALGREHFQNGLAARLLLAAPPTRPKRWTEAELSEGAQRSLSELYARLLALEPDYDQHGEPVPRVLSLTDSGKAAWVTFYNEHAQEQAKLTGDMAAAWSKLEGYAARLALIVHCVRSAWFDTSIESHDAVDEASIAAGVTLSRWFAGEAKRVYELFSETDEERDLRLLAEWLAAHGGGATVRKVVQGYRPYRNDSEGAEVALSKLARAGVGQWIDMAPKEQGGRPSRVLKLTSVNIYETPKTPAKQIGFVDTAGQKDDSDAFFEEINSPNPAYQTPF